MDLAGSSAIVTGGASGLGAATARKLAAAGAHVVILDVQEGDGLADELGGAFVRADVTIEPEVQVAVDIASDMGPLRSLVNCAGIGPPQRTVNRDGSPHDLAAFQKVIAINLVGTFNCIRLAAVAMSQTEVLPDRRDGEPSSTPRQWLRMTVRSDKPRIRLRRAA